MKECYESIKRCLTASTRDWALSSREAWLWGIIIGWDKECIAELVINHKWNADDVSRLKLLRSQYVDGLKDTAAERDKLKAQNVELLKALKRISQGLPSGEGLGGHIPLMALARIAREAIEKAGFDSNERWGNCAIPGIGVNSPAMMEARAGFAKAERNTQS